MRCSAQLSQALTDEIKAAFDQLQLELSLEINETMSQTTQKLLENFDDEVREKLKVRDEAAKIYLDRFEQLLMCLTRHEIGSDAMFIDAATFELRTRPAWADRREVPLGLYELPRRTGEAHLYRLNHPLGEAVIERAKVRDVAPIEVTFDYTNHYGRISALEPLQGQKGWLTALVLTVEALDTPEEHILLAGFADDGTDLSYDMATRLLTLSADEGDPIGTTATLVDDLDARLQRDAKQIQRSISERNARFFEAEADKLDGWADDVKVGLEREIKDIDRQIKETRRAAIAAVTLEEKLAGQKQLKSLETLRNSRRRNLFEAQDEIDNQRTALISQIESKLLQKTDLKALFTIRWHLH
jgi:hypothetical protein